MKIMKILKNHMAQKAGSLINTNSFVQVTADPHHLMKPPDIFKLQSRNRTRKKISEVPLLFQARFFKSSEKHNFSCISSNKDMQLSVESNSVNEYFAKGKKRKNSALSDSDKSLNKLSKDVPNVARDEESRKKRRRKENSEFLPLEDKTSANFVRFYKVQNDKYLLHLPFPSSFSVFGKLKMTLVCGQIEIFGFTLNGSSKNKTVELYTPRRCMNLNIISGIPPSTTSTEEIQKLIQNEIKMSEDDSENLLNNFKPGDALLLAENLFAPFTKVLNHYFDTDLFYENDTACHPLNMVRDLQCIVNRSPGHIRKEFTKHPQWNAIQLKKCAVVCGGKGVGKSTLLKYLINRSLFNEDAVLCLDLDPGQTEFTAPGCISAVLVRRPLLGPNFTHIMHPEEMMYLGEVDVSLNPLKYMKCVNYIINSCRSKPELFAVPWFVNTMGFNKGLGVDIMLNVIALLKPDVVIQIQSTDNTRNYPFLLCPKKVLSQKSLFVPQETSGLKYMFYNFQSCAKTRGIGFQDGFKPAELRELMTLSYFSQIVPFPYYSLNAVQPCWKSFSNIYFSVDAAVSSNDILKAFNGSLVGLCHLKEEMCDEVLEAEGREENYFKIAIRPSVMPCLGLGIVRGIDTKKEIIYILTHLSDDQLKGVNCLAIGTITPPHSVFLRQFYVDRSTVYTSINRGQNVQGLKRETKYLLQPKESNHKS